MAKVKAAPTAAELKAARRAELIAEANANPSGFFSFADCGLIHGFGEKAMGRLSAAGCPVAFRRMNPAMVCAWIAANPDKVAKISAEDDE